MFGWCASTATTRYQTVKPVERKTGGEDKINDAVVFASADYRSLLAYFLMSCGGCYCSTRVPDEASYSTVCCEVLLHGLAATMPLDTGITVASEGALHLYKLTV